ncbi:MAG: hypothetical protein U0L61_06505 [Alistipes sp.]|nr:hypothetical protein [Alistipes sp.]
MKKFWNLMLVALVVMLGATACTENLDSVDVKDDAGLSFYAEIDMAATRVDIADEDGDKTWETIWEGNESLTLVDGDTNNRYTFANSEAEPNKFTCTADGVSELLGGKVTVLSESSVDTYTSYVGKKFLAVSATVDNFDNTQKVSLTTNASFLRYTYNGEGAISFTMTTDHQVASQQLPFLDENMAKTSTVTFEGVSGENWVPFVPSWSVDGLTATLSYSIDGVECKQTTISNVKSGKIYNLGTLTEPEPEVEKSTLYFHPGVWDADNAWFSAHVWVSATPNAVTFAAAAPTEMDIKLTDENKDGVYECQVPVNMTHIIFCRMNPAYTEFGWNDDTMTDENKRVWNQTKDIQISKEEGKNHFYVTDWDAGEWSDENGVVVPEFTVGVIGFGNWDVDKDMTLEGDYYTLKNVSVAATNNTFKLRIRDSWAENYGMASSSSAEFVAINKDTMYSLVPDGKDMQLAAGTYDLYFNYATKEFYAMTPGTTPGDLAIPQYKVYVHPYNNVWTKFNLYSWDTAGANPTGAWPGATTTVTETINGYTYYVWTMPRSATGTSLSIILNDGSAQTADFVLGTLDKDYYLLLNGVTLSFVEDKENPEPEVVQGEPQPSTWALAGDFNSWGDKVMYTTDQDNLFVAKSVTIGAYKEIKVKQVGNWNTSYGGGINYLNSNIWTKVYSGGSNFSIINAGTYDIYFDNANKRIYVMKEGVDFASAVEQSSNGAAPDLSGASWGLCGAHNNWGNSGTKDTQLVWDGTIGLYVAKNAKLTGEFKVRANNSWGEDYGCGGTITVNASAGKAMSRGGGNCKVSSGTYDVYFDLATKKIWVKTPGSAAPTK